MLEVPPKRADNTCIENDDDRIRKPQHGNCSQYPEISRRRPEEEPSYEFRSNC